MEHPIPDGLIAFSDDDRSSVAADSWSIKSEYGGSVLDVDELVRQAESMVPSTAYSSAKDDDRCYLAAADSWSIKSEYGGDVDELHQADTIAPTSAALDDSSGKDDDDSVPSVLGLQSHWDSTYAGELANFLTHGDEGEVWFGETVMETVVEWTARLCASISAGVPISDAEGTSPLRTAAAAELSGWTVLDVGTGNGVFLHALWKQGFTDLTGTDYSDAAIELARNVAKHKGLGNIRFLVDDLLETKLEQQFRLVTDKGTLDAIGLHPDGASRRLMYWTTMAKLIAPGGLLILTSCNHTKQELADEASKSLPQEVGAFQYVEHVRSYPTFRFGGVEGTRVSTIALRLKRPD